MDRRRSQPIEHHGDGMTAGRFAEIAVWAPVYQTYSYRVPDELAAHVLPGTRVLVPFGSRAITGMVVTTSDAPPAGTAPGSQVHAIESVLDAGQRMSGELMGLCQWIAEYYEAPLGEVMRAAMPASMKVTASTRVLLTEAGKTALEAGGALTRRTRDVLAALLGAGGSASRRDLVVGPVRPADVDELIDRGLVAYSRDVRDRRLRPRTVRIAVLDHVPDDAELAALARSPAKLAALRALSGAGGAAAVSELARRTPRIASHLAALARAGLVRFEERAQPPRAAHGGMSAAHGTAPPIALNDRQRAALASIRAGMRQGRFSAYLLHGITGSGKTEIYLEVIADALAAGRTAIVLVPEISLTPQLAARFRTRFGDGVAVLHSGLSDRQRFDEWQRLASGQARIALGARSAVFAPVTDLGVVVVDEEHDSSFKQEEGVRYQGRDVALRRAQRAGAVCILGSATPSLETFHAARAGRYQLLSLPERATPQALPAITLVDLRRHRAESEAMLTAPLATAIAAALGRGEQIILFLNRRGFATVVVCSACGYSFQCANCSVSLTYHRAIDRLLCHYCSFQQRVPTTCPACRKPDTVIRKGLGTEKVAAAVAERFAGARVARLDRDVVSGARMSTILDRVARREIDILVGTQMVTKGHDFPGVTLVGVLCADIGLAVPDFRGSERTFQLLTQVAGRAGRGERPGTVLIQSYRPDLPAIASAAAHDYDGFYHAESAARQENGFPPYGYLCALRVDGPDADAVERTARSLADRAEQVRRGLRPGAAVLGPSEAPLVRLKGRTRWHVWLRAPDRKTLRRFLHAVVTPGSHGPGGSRITIDIDPVSPL